ncbi:MAG TPA: DNA-directed RNA polymerase subunit beta' [Candidatus Magasanikbacteria bacterium]|nr:DNA-directed RNA polymerase subunit beta' [Candidatus Magasanikbacteria bacterium]
MFKDRLLEFDAIRLKLASPEIIKDWSYGEVTKPETINYRTQNPEKGGLFAEEIFGPTKDWECYCGKYKKIRYKGIICDKCGVEVTHSSVRRERMGHIVLVSPAAHIWFLRSTPSKLGLVLDVSLQKLERVIYFVDFIINQVDENLKQETLLKLREEYKNKRKQIENEFQAKLKNAGGVAAQEEKMLQEKERKLAALEADFLVAETDLKKIVLLNVLSEIEYQELSLRYGHIFEAGIGAEAVRDLLSKIDLEKTITELSAEIKDAPPAKQERLVKRLKLFKSMLRNQIRPEWMIMTTIPVIPPDLRPMVALDGGRFATSDLNDLYRRVLNRNNRLKRLLDLNAPEIICRNEKRMLQEAVDALIDNSARQSKTVTASTGQKRQLKSLADILKGKQGRFRQNLLGKRTDYSGRSVIVVGPDLHMDECGLPKRMALELFKPFVMSKIIERGLAHNVRSASRFMEADHDEVWDILEEVTKGTYVLLNRAPTLHRLGIQAFKPILMEGKAIRLHPLVCTAFNADFDGDQMAVHVPLTEQARNEARDIMLSTKNLLKPATGSPIVTPKQDIAWGVFYLTSLDDRLTTERIKSFSNIREAEMAYKLRRIKLQQKIIVRFDNLDKFPKGTKSLVETTMGRIFFNQVLPVGLPYYNEIVPVKKLGEIVKTCMELFGFEKTAEVLDQIKTLGYRYITKSGYSLNMHDFPKVTAKKAIVQEGDRQVSEIEQQYAEGLLTDQERHGKIIEVWTKIKDEVVKVSRPALDRYSSVASIIESGARGSWGQLTQVIGMKGLVTNPAGKIIELPVKGNFKEGFDVIEYFISTHGARKGLTDMALRTANAGYLTRRLVDVAQDIIVNDVDCGSEEGVTMGIADSEKIGEKLGNRVFGRVVLQDVIDPKTGKMIVEKGQYVAEQQAREIDKAKVDSIKVRSILYCKKAKGVCQKCYGFDLGKSQPVEFGTAVGVVAAQSIGEPGTQLTLRTFHTGGVASDEDITQGLPRVEELFEIRPPKKKAFVADVNGRVEIASVEKRIIEGPDGQKIFEGRFGQKVIKIKFADVGESAYEVAKGDNVAVENGAAIKDGTLLITKKDGKEIRSNRPGNVVVEGKKVKVIGEVEGEKEYIIPSGYVLWVKTGDLVSVGDQLTDGHLDLNLLYELKGKEAVQKYIQDEIQDIYSSQGQKLNDKHIEVIIHQLFSRVYIKEAGDSELLPGEVVERANFLEENARVKKAGGKMAEGEELLLGITKVSLSTDSFLSSASFQETARVLINAAITGKVDRLEGLKENVIIGRQIPAGTGFRTR